MLSVLRRTVQHSCIENNTVIEDSKCTVGIHHSWTNEIIRKLM